MTRYALNLLIALDQLGNVLLGGNNPDGRFPVPWAARQWLGVNGHCGPNASSTGCLSGGEEPGHCRRMIEKACR